MCLGYCIINSECYSPIIFAGAYTFNYGAKILLIPRRVFYVRHK